MTVETEVMVEQKLEELLASLQTLWSRNGTGAAAMEKVVGAAGGLTSAELAPLLKEQSAQRRLLRGAMIEVQLRLQASRYSRDIAEIQPRYSRDIAEI